MHQNFLFKASLQTLVKHPSRMFFFLFLFSPINCNFLLTWTTGVQTINLIVLFINVNFNTLFKKLKIKVKKNFYKNSIFFNKYRWRMRRVLFFKKMKLKNNSIFLLSQKNKIIKKKTTHRLFLKQYLFIFKHERRFRQKWYSLVGGFISPFFWELRGARKWLRRDLEIDIADNYKFRKFLNYFKVSKRFLKRRRRKKNVLKTLYYKNFYFFSKFNIFYNDLKFFFKIIFDRRLKNASDWRLAGPYLFLSGPKRRKDQMFRNKITHMIRKTYKRVFRRLRRRNRYQRVWHNFWFKKFTKYKKSSTKKLTGFYVFKHFSFRFLRFWKNKFKKHLTKTIATGTGTLLGFYHVPLKLKKKNNKENNKSSSKKTS